MYLLLVVMSVFLGSRLFAVSTPVAQMTLYRVLVLGIPFVLGWQLMVKNKTIKLLNRSDASISLYGFLFWWAWAFISVIWVQDLKLWFQTLFLMSLGIFAIIALYFWTKDLSHWIMLIRGVWLMMTFQVFWGLFEIITGKYIFADLTKLDKYGTFFSQPMTRIPITSFANQNDYGTLLLAFLSISVICFHLTKHFWLKLWIIFTGLVASYLIYRTDSRMALLMLVFFMVFNVILHFKINLKRKDYIWIIISISAIVLVIFTIKPSFLNKISSILLYNSKSMFNGDASRISLWKNGLLFLTETFGLGVGAGNIEHWMAEYITYPVNNLTNIHNWWVEILVAYGVIVFVVYLIIYWLLLRKMWVISQYQKGETRYIAIGLLSFLVVFIFSSITSANNMLIEWHWVIFGLIISFIKIIEEQNIRRV